MPNPPFSRAEIQKKVDAIRQARGGIAGDPEADWQKAIQQLEQERSERNGRRNVFSLLNQPLVWIEKRSIEPFANWLDNADVFRIIEKVSPIVEAIGVIAGAIIIPVVIWQVGDREQEAKEQQERAIRAQTAVQNYLNQLSDILATGNLQTDEDLQTIVRASTLALLDNPDLQPDPELDDIENWRNDRKGQTIGYLSETGLVQVEVPEQSQNSKQSEEHKESVISLSEANLFFANLSNADLRNANLSNADLRDADLSLTNLSNADLSNANLSNADLSLTNLGGANLSGANLSSTDLFFTNLSGANLSDANLSSTDFSHASLSHANLGGANLSNIRNLTEEQLTQAELCNTKLPPGTNLDPNRDCKGVRILPY